MNKTGQYILAFDLGTDGCKGSLYAQDGTCAAETVRSYPTYYPAPLQREQRPEDWWNAVVDATQSLMEHAPGFANSIAAIALSGQSLAIVPLDAAGRLLRRQVPIWSDARGGQQAKALFRRVPEEDWYLQTGNGFPPPHYSVFKLMWLRQHEPEIFARTRTVLGSKDYINCRLTEQMVTDHSYASGSGVYDLHRRRYDPRLLEATGLPYELFPPIVPSTETIGELVPPAAEVLNLPAGIPVMAGGVDNSCMAAGARGVREGRLYNALGSSNWLTVTSTKPLLNTQLRPFVFDHVVPGYYVSAMSTFGGGSSLDWVREQLLPGAADDADEKSYDRMMRLGAESTPGAKGLLFIPTLAGGTVLEGGPNLRGAYLGIDLRHTRADLIRAALEGVAFAQRRALDALYEMTTPADEILLVGGGSHGSMWRQILADVYRTRVLHTTVGQQAATLGAASIAAVGIGIWPSFAQAENVHEITDANDPDPYASAVFERLYGTFVQVSRKQVEMTSLLDEMKGYGDYVD